MQLHLQIFEYENRAKLRSIDIGGEIWFVAQDVCEVLDLGNPRSSLALLDEDEKGVHTVDTPGGPQDVLIINEPGLYSLVLRSRKPEAKTFKRWITHEVIPQIRKHGGYSLTGARPVPAFVRRFNDNWHRVERGYFSVISELFIRLYGRLEQEGYTLPDIGATGREIRPDVSVGRLFADWLREKHPHHAENHKPYNHHFPNGVVVEARQYPNEVLPLFIEYVESEWIPKRAMDYLRARDMGALPYLERLMLPPPPP